MTMLVSIFHFLIPRLASVTPRDRSLVHRLRAPSQSICFRSATFPIKALSITGFYFSFVPDGRRHRRRKMSQLTSLSAGLVILSICDA